MIVVPSEVFAVPEISLFEGPLEEEETPYPLEVRVMLPVLLVTVIALVNVEVKVIVELSEVVTLPLDERVADVPMNVVEFM